MLIELNSDKIYKINNFKKISILKRTLILLYQTRFKVKAVYIYIILYIIYDIISQAVMKIIQNQIKMKDIKRLKM